MSHSITSPIYAASRKVFGSLKVGNLSTALLQSEKAAGRIVLAGTPSGKHALFRHDPYGMRVLEIREYPTPTIANTRVISAPTLSVNLPVVAAPMPIAPAKISPLPQEQPNPKEATTSPAPAAAPQQAVCRVSVEFKRGEDIYASPIALAVGDMIVVEGDRGHDMGRVLEVLPCKGPSVASVVRVATAKDQQTLDSLRREETAAVRLCQQRVKEHRIKNMKIEDVEFQMDGQKVTVYFSQEGFVDFRQLQRQLFRDFRCRVWLRTVPSNIKKASPF